MVWLRKVQRIQLLVFEFDLLLPLGIAMIVQYRLKLQSQADKVMKPSYAPKRKHLYKNCLTMGVVTL